MKLVLLGTTGYHPNELRHTACLMLPEMGVVLDAGTGFFRVREQIVTPELDVFLTHAHLDHVVGLTFLFDVLYQKDVRVRVHALAEKLEAIRTHLLAEPLFPAALPCEWLPLAAETPIGGDGRLTHFPLVHPGGSIGFRLDFPDRSLAYVTDTTASENSDYIERIRGVDVLVHECYFPDGFEELALKTGHSCTSEVARVAKAAEVGLLVLVHSSPLESVPDPIDVAKAKSIFEATLLASDWMEIEF